MMRLRPASELQALAEQQQKQQRSGVLLLPAMLQLLCRVSFMQGLIHTFLQQHEARIDTSFL
jgi:hypothetical protein